MNPAAPVTRMGSAAVMEARARSLATVAARMLVTHRHEVGIDHLLDQLRERDLVAPAELLTGLRRVADQGFDLGRTEIARVDLDQHLPGAGLDAALFGARARPGDAPADARERLLDELAHRVAFSRRQYVVVGLGLLDDQPH